jgi:hypothetical protein
MTTRKAVHEQHDPVAGRPRRRTGIVQHQRVAVRQGDANRHGRVSGAARRQQEPGEGLRMPARQQTMGSKLGKAVGIADRTDEGVAEFHAWRPNDVANPTCASPPPEVFAQAGPDVEPDAEPCVRHSLTYRFHNGLNGIARELA